MEEWVFPRPESHIRAHSCRTDSESSEPFPPNSPSPGKVSCWGDISNQATAFRPPRFSQQDLWNHPQNWWAPDTAPWGLLAKIHWHTCSVWLTWWFKKITSEFSICKNWLSSIWKSRLLTSLEKSKGLATLDPLPWATTGSCTSKWSHPVHWRGCSHPCSIGAVPPSSMPLGGCWSEEREDTVQRSLTRGKLEGRRESVTSHSRPCLPSSANTRLLRPALPHASPCLQRAGKYIPLLAIWRSTRLEAQK